MAVRTILCKIAPVNLNPANRTKAAGTGEVSVLKIFPAGGGTARTNTILNREQQLTLCFGDKIECLSGALLLTFHPDHPNLAHSVALGRKGNLRAEIEVNEETVSPRRLEMPNLQDYWQAGRIYTPGRKTF